MASLKEEYLNIITSGASLTALCEILAKEIGNPVALTLPTRTIIAHSRDYDHELVKEYTSATIDMTDEEQQENFDMMQKRLFTRHAFIGLYPYLRHKRMNRGCFWKGSLVAVIDVPIVNKVLIDDALHILDEAGKIFTPALFLNGGIPNGTIDPMETYLIGLLRGEIQPEHQQIFHCNIPFHKIKQWHIVWAEPNEIAFLPDVTGQIYAFCSSHSSIWCTSWSGGLVILVATEQLDYIQQMQDLMPDVVFSVSEAFGELMNTSTQLHQARFALHLAKYEHCDNAVVFAKNYKFPMFFLSHAQSAPENEYKSFLSEQIKEYDLVHNSTYYDTLRSYLLNNMDVNLMACDLNIHRNTVTYRLQRIEELFDVNLSDCRVITELYLSLFINLTKK